MLLVNSSLSAVEYWDKAEGDRFISQHGSTVIKTPDIPDARAELEAEMEAVKLVMCSLRTRHNALAFVNRLPSEVLAQIFEWVRKAYMDSSPHNSRRVPVAKADIQWVDLTHVCRQWRIVAINHPVLWSHIFIGTKFTEEFLRRSHGALVTINYTTDFPAWIVSTPQPDDDVEDLAGIISQNLSHMQSFGFMATRAHYAIILPFLLRPAPVLEKAVLTNGFFVSLDTTPAPSLPSDLFDRFAPRLRHLQLHGWSFPWSFHTFNTLVHLQISRLREPPGTTDTGDLGEFLAALSRMPSLQVLVLINVLPTPHLSSSQSTYRPEQVVYLPSLHTLNLSDTIHRCCLTLEHIAAPPTVEYEIRCTEHDGPNTLLVPWLSANARTSPAIRVLHVQQSDGVQITAFGNSEELPGITSRLLFRLILEDPGEGGPSRQEMENLLDALPLETMEVLHLSRWASEFPFLDWPGIFCGYPNLQHISVECEPDYDFGETSTIHDLLDIGISPRVGETPSPPFPSLVVLTLQGFDFGRDRDLYDSFLTWLGRWGPFKVLVLKDVMVETDLVDRLKALAFDLRVVETAPS
ncbi:hypothetical protein DENSPDRAFT_842825 [Dentipellis sp. KUC8613]|nr:hypothetical protein DENSPDRAFT_842825 [Dentipellis sp. KUC8613]